MGTEKAQANPRLQMIELFDYPAFPLTGTAVGVSQGISEVFPNWNVSQDFSATIDDSNQSPNAGPVTSGPVASGPAAASGVGRGPEEGSEDDSTARLAEECREAEDRGRVEGMKAGLELGREEASSQLESERRLLQLQAVGLSESFAVSRATYFHRIERETVGLALAIAARILRREAQMDPLLLTGAVRVALGQLADSTSVTIRVPALDQPLWEEALALVPGLVLRPRVIADERMELGDCRMETEIGSANLGLLPQLKEIERGFFDRLDDRLDACTAQDARTAQLAEADSGGVPEPESGFANLRNGTSVEPPSAATQLLVL